MSFVIDDTYKSFYPMLKAYVRDHRKEHGGEYEDLIQVASAAFMEAWHSWDETLSSFSTWLTIRVKGALKDEFRHRAKWHKRHRLFADATLPLDAFSIEYGHFDWQAYLEGLKIDSRGIVRAVFDMPLDVRLNLRITGRRVTPKRIRKAIKDWLLDIEWTEKRILTSFEEIRRSLQ